MQSDQKIGLCLLIGLLGFAAALGFGRRERAVDPSVRPVELTTADRLTLPVESVAVGKLETPQTVELAPPEREAPAVVDIVDEPVVVRPQTSGWEVHSHVERPSPQREVPERRESAAVAPTNRRPEMRPYTVKAGDTLSGIAARHLGDANRYLEVFEANRDQLPHADALRVGQTLQLPVGTQAETRTATIDPWDVR